MNTLTGTELSNLHIGVAPKICYGDFDAHTTMCDIANRIAADLRFEQHLKKLHNTKLIKKRGKVK